MPKYSKFKQPQKIHPIAYIIGAIFLALVAVVIIFTVPSKSEKMYQDYFKAQVSTEQFNLSELAMPKEHLYKNIKLKDLEKKISSNDLVIVYMGGTWCSTCLNEISIYSSELEKNETLLEKAKNIYYVEVPQNRDLKGLEEFIEKHELNENMNYPQLLTFYNGKLVETKYTPGIQQTKDIKTNVWKYYNNVLEEVK